MVACFDMEQAGHQRHAWTIRVHEGVQKVFKTLWGTENLLVSFDGSCWIPADCKKKDANVWTHADQAPSKKGLVCYQGFVSLTDNVDRSLVVYEGSHLLHKPYVRERGLTGSKDWMRIDEDYLQSIAHLRRVVPVKAGSMVVWDSRTFHQVSATAACYLM